MWVYEGAQSLEGLINSGVTSSVTTQATASHRANSRQACVTCIYCAIAQAHWQKPIQDISNRGCFVLHRFLDVQCLSDGSCLESASTWPTHLSLTSQCADIVLWPNYSKFSYGEDRVEISASRV